MTFWINDKKNIPIAKQENFTIAQQENLIDETDKGQV